MLFQSSTYNESVLKVESEINLLFQRGSPLSTPNVIYLRGESQQVLLSGLRGLDERVRLRECAKVMIKIFGIDERNLLAQWIE